MTWLVSNWKQAGILSGVIVVVFAVGLLYLQEHYIEVGRALERDRITSLPPEIRWLPGNPIEAPPVIKWLPSKQKEMTLAMRRMIDSAVVVAHKDWEAELSYRLAPDQAFSADTLTAQVDDSITVRIPLATTIDYLPLNDEGKRFFLSIIPGAFSIPIKEVTRYVPYFESASFIEKVGYTGIGATFAILLLWLFGGLAL